MEVTETDIKHYDEKENVLNSLPTFLSLLKPLKLKPNIGQEGLFQLLYISGLP